MGSLKLSLAELLYRRELLRLELESRLTEESRARARSDYHAKKPPRPCGFTVHSVVGCKFACSYCYLPDMGLSTATANPYGLTGEEMVYALLSNEYFLPGRLGSLIALGSLGEPFVDERGFRRTLEYLSAFAKYLGNPVQFSTKAALTEGQVEALAGISTPLSPLVTVITLRSYKLLEPGAPTPTERLEVIKRMRRAGLKPFLFLRPIIPGVNTEELEEILVEAKSSGAVGVVLGGFRATASNLARLKRLGLDLSELKSRLPREPARGEQVPVFVDDLKRELVGVAREKGLVPFLSACCANNYAAFLWDSLRSPCPGLDFVEGKFCTRCPVNCPQLKTEVDPEEVRRLLSRFTGETSFYIEVEDRFIKVRGLKRRRLKPYQKHIMEVGYRRRLILA